MTYAIRCTPGGLLRDEGSGEVIRFASYAEAEAEALRLTREAYSNQRVAGFDFTPVPMPDPAHDDKIVRFEDARDRRIEAESASDQAQWEDFRDRLLAIMMACDFQNSSLMAATINALLRALERSGMDIDEAKTSIIRVTSIMK
jgi:hypothetical protein